jgi:hypothetical protein
MRPLRFGRRSSFDLFQMGGAVMKMRLLCGALAILFLSAGPLPAGDLSKLARTIAREPVYRSKPKYCLLVFGQEPKTRIWLVQDGDVLYVDRNGNGDLTEPGKKVVAEKAESASEGYLFKAGDVYDGSRVHKGLTVGVLKLDYLASLHEQVKTFLTKNPKAPGYVVLIEVEMPGRKGTGLGGRVQQRTSFADAHGLLQFADKPEDAPIIHFDGPLQVTLYDRLNLAIGRETDVVLGVGTAGLGTGTTTYIDYEGVIPEKLYPTIEVVYPARAPGELPVRDRYELKRRC